MIKRVHLGKDLLWSPDLAATREPFEIPRPCRCLAWKPLSGGQWSSWKYIIGCHHYDQMTEPMNKMPGRCKFCFDEDSLELETWKLSVLKLFPNSAISSAQNSPLEREILSIENINFTLIDCITSRITWRGCIPISGTPLASERRLGSLFQPRTSQCQSSLSYSKVFPKCEIDISTQTEPVLIFFLISKMTIYLMLKGELFHLTK